MRPRLPVWMQQITVRLGGSANNTPRPAYVRAPTSPSSGFNTPPVYSPHTIHGHPRPHSRTCCGIDRFTLLAVCFVALVLYTVVPHEPLSSAIERWTTTPTPSTELPPAVLPPPAVVRPIGRLIESQPSPSDVPVVDIPGEVETFTLERIPLVAASDAFPMDSTAETLMLRPTRDKDMGHSYHVCTFTNVCAAPDGIQFRFQNYTAWREFEGLAKRCEVMEYYWANHICHCFHYAFKPLVLPYEFSSEITQPIAEVSPAKLVRRTADPFAHVADKKSAHAHYWSVHKWVSHHHIAHWAQKLMMFQSIFQHHSLLFGSATAPLPPLDGMVFHDTSNTNPPLEDHLLNIFNLTLESAVGYREEMRSGGGGGGGGGLEWAHPALWDGADAVEQMAHLLDPDTGRLIWAEDIVDQRYMTNLAHNACKDKDKCRVANPAMEEAMATATKSGQPPLAADHVFLAPDGSPLPDRVVDPSLHTCFDRVSMTPSYGLLSQDSSDARRFRRVTAARMSLPSALANPCPPRRAILLTRADRRILNSDLIDSYLLTKYNLVLEHHEITGRNTSAEQIRLFATSGLVLSSHSSQLINVLFSHGSQALVEITPEFYNVDFSAYAHALGLHFNYALGGHIPVSAAEHPQHSSDYTYVHDPLMKECVHALQGACPAGDSWCIIRVSPDLCGKIIQWPNKQMNFLANITAVQIAVQQAIGHVQDQCFGKW